MKRVVLDHCVPRPFRKLLESCEARTAYECGWAKLKNGELISAAEKSGFDVLITADKNLRYQQHLPGRKLAVIELPTNRLALLPAYAPETNRILRDIKPGEYRVIEPAAE